MKNILRKELILNLVLNRENNNKILLFTVCSVFLFAASFDVFISPTSCINCLTQRLIWSLIGVLCAFCTIFKYCKIVTFLNFLLLTLNSFIAANQLYHYYFKIEDTFCKVDVFNNTGGSFLSCNESPTIFGLHIASYNLVLSVFMLIFILVPIFYNDKKI